MKRFVRLLVLITWLIGTATGGFTAELGPPDETEPVHVVAESDLGRVTVRAKQIVLAVQLPPIAHCRVAVPAPSSFRHWLRASPQSSSDTHADAAI